MNNRKPKFSRLLTNNNDGSYSLKTDVSTDGYGNDAIILLNALDNQLETSKRESTVVLFRESNQAKSATDNIGTFEIKRA